MFYLIILLIIEAKGISVPQPVVLPPPLSHVRLITANQRNPVIYTSSNSLHGSIVSPNLETAHRRIPARNINSHLDLDVTEYPIVSRHIDRNHRRPNQQRPVEYYPVQKDIYVNDEQLPNLNGLPANLKNPKFEFGFVPLTSIRVSNFVSAINSTLRNDTLVHSKRIINPPKPYVAPSQPYVAPSEPYVAPSQPYITSNQADIVTTLSDFNKTFELDCNGKEDLGWCELGENYPRVDIEHVISRCSNLLTKLYVEVPETNDDKTPETIDYQLDLINKRTKERKNYNPWSWSSYSGENGKLCEVDRKYIKPSLSKNVKGKWYLIVQTENYIQKVHLETCRNAGESCKKLGNCGLKSKCVQKYSYQLLISIDPQKFSDCPFMGLYRFPSLCVCHANET
ncbi:uncharacterized protein [Centruroides vittatus]|uniref:uncharacterized protein isoform X1 n=1 Tax=Centruroides vittatus TaxID=120091 RepID=UPI003510AD84